MTAPFVREIVKGTTGPDVLAVKRALKKAGFGKGIALSNVMGATAILDLKAFQKHVGLTPDGVYGPATHAKLEKFFDAYGISLLEKEADAQTPRNEFLAVADATVAHRGIFDYTERGGSGPGERGWFRASALNWEPRKSCDCSQHFIGCGHHAGLKHPIFNTEGATGAILGLTRIKLADALPGDAVVFVSNAEPAGEHVTILRKKLANGDWQTVNMGTQGQPANTTLSGEQAAHPGSWQVVVRLPTP